jgi:hypothetical protein
LVGERRRPGPSGRRVQDRSKMGVREGRLVRALDAVQELAREQAFGQAAGMEWARASARGSWACGSARHGRIQTRRGIGRRGTRAGGSGSRSRSVCRQHLRGRAAACASAVLGDWPAAQASSSGAGGERSGAGALDQCRRAFAARSERARRRSGQ